jgi:ADP-heptose:LPS heptosyltransferase
MARSAGIRPSDDSYEFFFDDDDISNVREMLLKEGVGPDDKVVVFCPGGNWGPKRWPADCFARLGDALVSRHGVKIVLAAAGKDLRLAQEIAGMMRSKPAVVAGRTTLKELGALLARASLVVANDTGPMHMAVAVKAGTIALFGPTSPEITGPYGKGNYRVIRGRTDCEVPCYDVTCRDNRCMRSITVEEVLRVAEEKLMK